MRTLKFLIQKEFIQIFRDRIMLRIIFVMPLMQLLILPNAANFEMRNISLSIVDHDHSAYSQKFIQKIVSSKYFILHDYSTTYEEGLRHIENDKADMIIEIPEGFERTIVRDNGAKVLVAANAINGQTSGLAVAYATNIIRDFNAEIAVKFGTISRVAGQPTIEITSSTWFNPLLNYKFYMVPGVLAILVTMVGFFLSSLNIVKEKENGTIEQLNVSPIKKYHFILAKIIPFWTLGLAVLSIGLIVSALFYGIVPAGNILLVYFFSAIYLFAILGFGLLASTFSETQQQSMFIAYFFMMLFVLLGGLFSPIENMPEWAQYLTYINPVSYYLEALRMIGLKGSGLWDLNKHIGVILLFATVFYSLAIFNYKKTT